MNQLADAISSVSVTLRVCIAALLGVNLAADIQHNLSQPLCVDAFHCTAPMSTRFADLIAGSLIGRNCSPKLRMVAEHGILTLIGLYLELNSRKFRKSPQCVNY